MSVLYSNTAKISVHYHATQVDKRNVTNINESNMIVVCSAHCGYVWHALYYASFCGTSPIDFSYQCLFERRQIQRRHDSSSHSHFAIYSKYWIAAMRVDIALTYRTTMNISKNGHLTKVNTHVTFVTSSNFRPHIFSAFIFNYCIYNHDNLSKGTLATYDSPHNTYSWSKVEYPLTDCHAYS